MNKITQLVKREIFKHRLRKVYKRWFPELDKEAIEGEIGGLMDWYDDDDDISFEAVERNIKESVSYWSC